MLRYMCPCLITVWLTECAQFMCACFYFRRTGVGAKKNLVTGLENCHLGAQKEIDTLAGDDLCIHISKTEHLILTE